MTDLADSINDLELRFKTDAGALSFLRSHTPTHWRVNATKHTGVCCLRGV